MWLQAVSANVIGIDVYRKMPIFSIAILFVIMISLVSWDVQV